MADIALGIIGVLGVVLDSATKTYGFISSIKDAPKAITTLGEHVKGLKLFVGPLLRLLSKPSIRSRPQNKDFLPSVEHAFSGFANILNSIDSEIELYVKCTPGSAAPVWGGWLSRRRWKYAFKKSSILELEARLLGTIAALDLNLRPLDLSWSEDLSEDDRETIHTLQRRAESLYSVPASRLGSTASLTSSRYSIESVSASNDHDDEETTSRIAGDSEERPDESDADDSSDEEYNPWSTTVTFGSGDHSISARGVIDTSLTVSAITQRIVDEVNVPMDPLAARTLSDGVDRSVDTPRRVKLVFKLANDEKTHESWFHVLPDSQFPTNDVVFLGLDLIRRTQAFVSARLEAQLRPE